MLLHQANDMGAEVNIVTKLHEATHRDYVARMLDEKVHCMEIAKQYGQEYWDGDRRYGYGGYKYIPGRWKPVAEKLIDRFGLNAESSVLDVGCGKAFLLYELKLLIPDLVVRGFDDSPYGISQARSEIRPYLTQHDARHLYPFADDQFDLVISLGCLHNLKLFEIVTSLGEIQRVSNNAYVMVESYRDEREMFNLECWALTAESLLEPNEWLWLFEIAEYAGDYEFIYFT